MNWRDAILLSKAGIAERTHKPKPKEMWRVHLRRKTGGGGLVRVLLGNAEVPIVLRGPGAFKRANLFDDWYPIMPVHPLYALAGALDDDDDDDTWWDEALMGLLCQSIIQT